MSALFEYASCARVHNLPALSYNNELLEPAGSYLWEGFHAN